MASVTLNALLYFWLFARARHKPGRAPTEAGKAVFLERGQTMVGREQVERELSIKRFRFTPQRFRTAMDYLERAGEISTFSTSAGTIATINRIAFPERFGVKGMAPGAALDNQRGSQAAQRDRPRVPPALCRARIYPAPGGTAWAASRR